MTTQTTSLAERAEAFAMPDGAPVEPPTGKSAEVWALVQRVQAAGPDAPAAFEAIYDRYVEMVFRFAYRRVRNHQLAEDITADTFLRALNRIHTFTWRGTDLGGWLLTIARNLVADYFKSGRYRLEVTTGHISDTVAAVPGPDAEVFGRLVSATLCDALMKLNPYQQQCLVLRFLRGLSVAETAQSMGKNEGAVKALQYRATRALGRLLPADIQEPT